MVLYQEFLFISGTVLCSSFYFRGNLRPVNEIVKINTANSDWGLTQTINITSNLQSCKMSDVANVVSSHL